MRILRPFLLIGLVFFHSLSAQTDGPAARQRLSFNEGWRFHRGDPQWMAPQLDYASIRPWLLPNAAAFHLGNEPRPARPSGSLGSDLECVQPGFDDASWRTLTLPHDWGIEGPFQQDLPGDTGKLPWLGVGWYRKHFKLPVEDKERRLVLEIDGAMSCPLVWLNGQFVGGWAYGYSSFQLDLTPYARPGAENVLAIRLDTLPESSRWYPGAGLYRNVWLTKTNAVHIAPWGLRVTTPRISAQGALIAVEVHTRNESVENAELTLENEIRPLTPAGPRAGKAAVLSSPKPFRAAAGRECSVTQNLELPSPALWSPASPALYTLTTTLRRGSVVVDQIQTVFGVREVEFDADRGLLLNGKPLRIQGVCLHHDLGALGAAINTRAIERQLEILRSMGCNAIRTSHNPPAPELLDACDRLGFLVFDEAFDCWAKGKGRNDYHRYFNDWHEADLRALVRRDRNHPSVVLWSIGNEVLEQWGDDGQESWKIASRLAGIIREEDRTRAISGAFNGGDMGFNGVQHVVDAIGYNYRTETYARFRRENPHIPVFGSETASTLSSRGEYFFPVGNDKLAAGARANFQVSSYDLYSEGWASQVEEEWRAADAAPGYAGEFVWTGFDYLGEPTPYNSDATNLLNFSDPKAREQMARQLAELGKIQVPSRSSYFGIIDLAGLPKDRFYLYQSRWRPDLPMAHLLPHWTWPGREGEITPVHVYTSGDEGELFLNGKSLGRRGKNPGEYRLRWDEVPYSPGDLHVVTYRQGKVWAEDRLRTAGKAATLQVQADRQQVRADGRDLVFVTLTVCDAKGTPVPQANNRVDFSVEGPAELIATDNGDPTSFESFQASGRRAFNGKAVAIVRSLRGQSGQLTIRATSEGLEPASLTLSSSAP